MQDKSVQVKKQMKEKKKDRADRHTYCSGHGTAVKAAAVAADLYVGLIWSRSLVEEQNKKHCVVNFCIKKVHCSIRFKSTYENNILLNILASVMFSELN